MIPIQESSDFAELHNEASAKNAKDVEWLARVIAAVILAAPFLAYFIARVA